MDTVKQKQVNKYKYIYKCRVCGKVIERKCPEEYNIGPSVDLLLAMGLDIGSKAKANHAKLPQIMLQGISMCEDHIGITDLIGVSMNPDYIGDEAYFSKP